MFTFLLIVHALIAAALVTVILMQRSEGGGLGMGSGPSGLMTARGAADFLTRATAILAGLFVAMAFLLATYASLHNRTGKLDTSLAQQPDAKPITAPVAPGAAGGIPMMGGGTLGGAPGVPVAPGGPAGNALAPAAAGLPPATAPNAAAQAELRKTRSAPTAANLKTIDTKAASGGGSIGINGVSSQPNAISASHATSHVAPSGNSAVAAPVAKANRESWAPTSSA